MALCSQDIYESLLDDTFRIKCGSAREVALSSWGLLHGAGLVGETQALKELVTTVNDL